MRRPGQEGFTLVELLVAMTILGLIVTAITSATVLALHTLSGRDQAVTDTSGGQLLASYLVSDAQSADHVNPSKLAATDANSFSCSTGALLELRWIDGDGTTGTTDVVYKVEAAGTVDPAGQPDFELTRRVYRVDVATKSCGAPTSESVIAPNVAQDATKTFATCDNTGSCDDGSLRVGLQVQAFSNSPKSGNYVAYSYTVYGTRRIG